MQHPPSENMGKYDPGAVYILNEEDQSTGARSDYYKIGLVGPTQTVSDRIEKQHQTGNPRKIIDVHSFDSLAPFFVEKHLHNHFRTKCHFREWFKLTAKDLQDVIAEAARYEKIMGPQVAAVRGFQDQPSNGQSATLSPTDQNAAEKIHEKLVQIVIDIQELDFHISIQKLHFKLETAGHEGGIDGITTLKIKGIGDPKFKPALFKAANEPVYNQFCTKRKISVSKGFAILPQTKSKNHPKLHEAEKAAKAAFEMNKPVVGMTVNGTVKRTSALEKAHEAYINLLQDKEVLTEQKEMYEFELKKMCGLNEGIDGICKWKRTEKFEFDETAFKRTHPNLYLDPQFYEQSAESIAISVIGARNYV